MDSPERIVGLEFSKPTPDQIGRLRTLIESDPLVRSHFTKSRVPKSVSHPETRWLGHQWLQQQIAIDSCHTRSMGPSVCCNLQVAGAGMFRRATIPTMAKIPDSQDEGHGGFCESSARSRQWCLSVRRAAREFGDHCGRPPNPRACALPMHHADRPNGGSTSADSGSGRPDGQADQPKRHSSLSRGKGGRVQIPGDIADRNLSQRTTGPGGQTCQTPRSPGSQWLKRERLAENAPRP